MKLIKIFLFNIIIVFIVNQTVIADTPFFLDFKYSLTRAMLAKSSKLLKIIRKGIKDLKVKKKIQEEEKKIMHKK